MSAAIARIAGTRRTALALAALCALLPIVGCGGDGIATPVSDALVEETRALVDASRATPANGAAPAVGTRTLDTRLWYREQAAPGTPACGRRGCALVVLAHGFGGNTARFEALARDLADRGWIVAAPAFPLTNDAAPGGHLTGLGDTVRQPGDLSFVVDELLAAAGDPADPLAGRLDPQRSVGLLGHSLGGTTAVAATRLDCCRDARIAATVLVAPGVVLVEPLFRSPGSAAGPPTLVVNGSRDPVVPPATSRAWFESIEGPAGLVVLDGGAHSDIVENVVAPGPLVAVTAAVADGLFAEFLGGNAGALHAALEDARALGHEIAGR